MKVKHSRFSVGVILFALAMLPTMAQERAAQIREKIVESESPLCNRGIASSRLA